MMRKRLVPLLFLPVRLLLWPLRLLWRGWGKLGLVLRRQVTRFSRALWSRVLRPPWRFLGRMGLALRNLIDRLLWRPFRFMALPWWLFYRRVLHRPLRRLLAFVFAGPLWLWRRAALAVGKILVDPLRTRLSARWRAGRATRFRRRRLLRSWLRVRKARLRYFFTRPQPPRKALVAPPAPAPFTPQSPHQRVTRLATTALALGLVLVASFITAQEAPDLRDAEAENAEIAGRPTATPTLPPPTATPTPVASPTPWPTPDPLNSGGSVIFTLRQQGNSDLYALSIGQSQPVRLTNDPADDRDPAWHPDGELVAFSSHRDGNWELYLLSLLDGDLTRLTRDPAFDGGPSWSPDGRWLVFESYRNNNLDLYLMSADGRQGPIRLTQNPAPDFAPVWSPDGRHIAFTSWRGGNKDIFILSLDVADDSAAYNVTGTPGQFEDNPAFSPDGTALAYEEDSSGRELVYALPLVDYAVAGDPVSHGQGHHPSWSPDGKALTFIHSSGDRNHLIAGSLDTWSVAPQAFTTQAFLDDPDWSARVLPVPLPKPLLAISQSPSPRLYEESVQEPAPDGPPYLLRELPVNAPAPYLSDRVDQSFVALRQRVQQEAGWDFLGELEQMYEAMQARPAPGQSDRTWNKAGRAFDYTTDYVLVFDPQVEVVRERQEADTFWHTYLKAAAQDGTQGEPLRDLPWDFRARYGAESRYYDQGGKLKDAIPAGYYVDFTALAADYGWQRTAASDNWRTYFPGINYWHYENRQGLNWEQAMLELYTAEEILANFRR